MAKKDLEVKALRNWDKLKDLITVPPGKKISLKKDYDPEYEPKKVTKAESEGLLRDGVAKLALMQDMLYAQDRYGILLVFQAMDAAGKDGTIKHVTSGLNPQGCEVYSFKAPSSQELDHDYMWRCEKVVPERGRIGIFNRSYYEEVLITKVHPEILRAQKLPPKSIDKNIYKRRYEEINNFEKYLANNGIVVLKFFLNVSKAEQKKRFLERIDNPDKNWKFSVSDAKERGHWDQYMEAYEDVFNNTSTKWAPWHIIPANNKWFMRLAVGAVLYEAMRGLKLKYPDVTDAQRQALQEAKKLLLAEK